MNRDDLLGLLGVTLDDQESVYQHVIEFTSPRRLPTYEVILDLVVGEPVGFAVVASSRADAEKVYAVVQEALESLTGER